jgi:transcriptional regulator with XRE-family HTH domain
VTITTAQMRGARGLLNWSQSELSKRTSISTTSIGNIEAGNTQARESTLKLIRQAFENAGIEFIGTEGMRKRNDYIRTFEGKDQFWGFYEDIYTTLRENPGEVVVSNADEQKFLSFVTQDQIEIHKNRMIDLNNVTYRILINQGDEYLAASSKYARYKWMPESLFSSVPFYVYGHKLAIIRFNPEPCIYIIANKEIADAYRLQFNAIWDMGVEYKETAIRITDKAV